MKHICYFILFTLVLVSCGTDSHHFKIDGRLLNLNQGEFYVYSPDGGIDGIDTIKVNAGRFAYEIPCDAPSTLVIVFPNFSEQPIFAEPGKTVDIKGDASRLKEMKATGTKSNELMNKFREQIASASPPEMVRYAAQFIKDHPESIVSTYLLTKYFIQTTSPDYKQAAQLTDLMIGQQEENGYLKRLGKQLHFMGKTSVGGTLPKFKAYDINGTAVSNDMLKSPIAVINVWAIWSYESIAMQQMLHQMQKKSGGRLKVLSINIDASRNDCRNILKRDTITWPTICDEEMFDGTLINQLGMSNVPDNIILQNGRIVARSLQSKALHDRIEQLLK